MDYDAIDEHQMVGFMSTRIPYAVTSDRIPIIGQDSLIQNLKKLILTIGHTMMPAKCVTVTKKGAGGPTNSRKAMDFFMAYVRYVMWNAFGGLIVVSVVLSGLKFVRSIAMQVRYSYFGVNEK